MPPSVLGKRARSPVCSGSTGVQTRAKRRTIAVLGNDENNNPFITRPSTAEPGNSASEKPASQRKPAQPRPAKHGRSQSKATAKATATATPNKISAHFSVTKQSAAAGVFNDGKPSTPQTPRHHDALRRQVAVTPRHRVQISSNPATPRTPCTPSGSASNVYNEARKAFARCTDPSILVGREDEKLQISTFVSERVQSNHGGCMYISGPPGTGKSAFVSRVCRDSISSANVVMSIVNCMSIKSAKDLATTLCDTFAIDYESARAVDFDFLRPYFAGEHNVSRKYVVVLDEIDRLVDLDLKLLYSLFEWSMLPSSSLILVGIANALDLTDRFLPRLKSRNLKPDLLPFMPYTASQIANIVTEKVKSLLPSESCPDPNFTPFLHPAAIQFVSKKVASQTGDLRKVFDICHRAICLAESDAKASAARLRLEQASPSRTQATPLMENINLSSPPMQRSPSKGPAPLRQTTLTSSLSHLTVETAPRATIAHMAKVTAQVFGNGASQRLATLNIQQKAVLCSLSALEKKKRDSPSQNTIFATPSKKTEAAPTIKKLYEAYTLLCKRENLLHPLTNTEFRDVVSGLETLSLVQAVSSGSSFSAMPLTPSKTPSRRSKGGFSGFAGAAVGGADEKRMASCVGHAELIATLQGPGSEILREIIEGDGILA